MATSVLHIKTEIECKVFLFDEEKGIVTPDRYFNLEVRKGEQDLLFISTADKDIQCSLQYKIEETDCDYRIMVEKSQFKAKTGLTQDRLFKLLSAKVTNEEIEKSVEDEYGVVYSPDGYQLLKCKRKDILSYQVKEGCRLIRKDAFSCGSLSSITLPDSLTHIGDLAFKFCKNLTSINLPDGLTHIGDLAFYGCDSLTSINLPDSLTDVGGGAFSDTQIRKIVNNSHFFSFHKGCLINETNNKLVAFLSDDTTIELPDDLTHIGRGAFWYCKNLTSINLPDGLTHIGNGAFANCHSLACINLPNSLTHIGHNAFGSCIKLTNINLPDGLTHIGNVTFENCHSLACINLPDSLTHIGDSAFKFCKNLTSINLPDGLTHISDWAFYGCNNLASINLPDSLTHIGNGAFAYCEKLSYIYIHVGKREFYERLLPSYLHDKIKEETGHIDDKTRQKSSCYLFFDTETTGVPKDYKAPASNTNNWPRLVQLGWILTDESGNEITSGNEIIKPEGFVIPVDASRVHGITTEVALREGKSLEQVLQSFLKDTEGIKCFVGHNVSFDQRVVGAELHRLGIADTVSTARSLDTMIAATDFCKIPGTYGYKWPKLIELHRKLFGCDFEDAHDAMADITATKKCFFEMKRRGLI